MLSVAVAGISFSQEKREESLTALFERLVSITERDIQQIIPNNQMLVMGLSSTLCAPCLGNYFILGRSQSKRINPNP